MDAPARFREHVTGQPEDVAWARARETRLEKQAQARPGAVRLQPEAAAAAARVDPAADYVDVFELEKSDPDGRSPEQLVRLAFSRAPAWWRPGITWAHRHVLRFHLDPGDAPDHVIGWRIAESDANVVRLEASGPLMLGTLCLAKVDPTRAQLVTALTFRRRVLSRLVWAVVGPVHRRAAPALMERAAES